MKTLLLTVSLSFFAIGLQAQDFEVPKDYKLETAEDYPQYEEDVKNCFNWLMETPYDDERDKRIEASKFLFTWMSGSPSVHPEMNENILTFLTSAPAEMLVLFLGGWTNYSLENDYSDDKIEGTKAALNAVIEFYQKNRKALGRDKNIQKYVKMKEEGTLDEFIEKNA